MFPQVPQSASLRTARHSREIRDKQSNAQFQKQMMFYLLIILCSLLIYNLNNLQVRTLSSAIAELSGELRDLNKVVLNMASQREERGNPYNTHLTRGIVIYYEAFILIFIFHILCEFHVKQNWLKRFRCFGGEIS